MERISGGCSLDFGDSVSAKASVETLRRSSRRRRGQQKRYAENFCVKDKEGIHSTPVTSIVSSPQNTMISWMHGTRFVSRRVRMSRQRFFTASSKTTLPSTLNCAKALIKQNEADSFQSILKTDVTTLQGIGPKHQEWLHQLRIQTVADLANYKFFHLAKAITVLAEQEEDDGRLDDAQMNIDKGVDKAYESQSFREIAKAPVSALQGLTDEAGEIFKHLGVKTVEELGRFKFCTWAVAMQTAAKFEK